MQSFGNPRAQRFAPDRAQRFRAASCTKTFTATAILLLHQQGKSWVSLRDVYRYTGRPKEVCKKCLHELAEMDRLVEREEKRTRLYQLKLA